MSQTPDSYFVAKALEIIFPTTHTPEEMQEASQKWDTNPELSTSKGITELALALQAEYLRGWNEACDNIEATYDIDIGPLLTKP